MSKEIVCCYCGNPKNGKIMCCSENHFEEIFLEEVEDSETWEDKNADSRSLR